MQYSNVDSHRTTPFPKGKGTCAVCEAPTIAKCGEKIMWHWAHKSKLDCDAWWEKETEWHRGWKERFPESFREVVHHSEITGEKHRADVKCDNGIVLEIQNSPISLEELRSREQFYKNLVWIVNGEKFAARFKVALNNFLPDPQCQEFEDIVFVNHGGAFWRKSQHPEALKTPGTMVELHHVRKIQPQINKHYVGHHSFAWQRPHVAWMEATCPVYLDLDSNSDILWRIENYRNQFYCVRALAKDKVVQDIINETKIEKIGSSFSVLTG